jgi:TolB-like protein/Tfp pilus assembly protein PilF
VPSRNFFVELKRRNVYRAAVAYGVVAWFLTQLTTQVFPFFDIPNSAIRLVVIVLALGFPVAMSVAWLYELTPEGIVRADDVQPAQHRNFRRLTGRVLDFVIIGVLLLVIVMLFYRRIPFRTETGEPVSPKSIAVLPFENLSDDKQNAYFADGVQDEILTDLAKIADLKVISRTSVMQYRNVGDRGVRAIAKELGVAHVLEGSAQRIGNVVRVRAQLIDARTDTHMWAEQYERELADVFASQSAIAQKIAEQLRAKISPGEKEAIAKTATTDPAAYHLYLEALALWADSSDPIHGKEKLPEAARVLTEAVARDATFFRAWCLLAKTHAAIYRQGYDHTPARLELAHQAVQMAQQLRPDAGETHLALATYYYFGFRDFDKARRELVLAREELPNEQEVFQYAGLMDRRQGRWPEATRDLEQALELDPRNMFLLQQMALTYHPQRLYQQETRIWDRVLTIAPGDPLTRVSRAEIFFDERADIRPYVETLNAVLAENPAAGYVDTPAIALCERNSASAARALQHYPQGGEVTNGVNVPRSYWEGVAARQQGDRAKGDAAFAAARNNVSQLVDKQPDFAPAVSLLGLIDAALGRKEEALTEGRRACELLPTTTDAIDGAALAIHLAQIYAWAGEKDLAIQQIAAIARVPSRLSYGFLKLDPEWDSLRGDPRFEKIVASLAPPS